MIERPGFCRKERWLAHFSEGRRTWVTVLQVPTFIGTYKPVAETRWDVGGVLNWPGSQVLSMNWLNSTK
jgi:hypothetical protein